MPVIEALEMTEKTLYAGGFYTTSAYSATSCGIMLRILGKHLIHHSLILRMVFPGLRLEKIDAVRIYRNRYLFFRRFFYQLRRGREKILGHHRLLQRFPEGAPRISVNALHSVSSPGASILRQKF